jgi:lysophospholipase
MHPPNLSPRFREPEGWRWHSFTASGGYALRFGAAAPKSRVPDAIVIALPGLGEFAEKYFEVAQDMLDRNLGFWVLDWHGQGRSDRYLKNPQKRHAGPFARDVADLHDFIIGYVKHAAVHPDVGRIPLVMLAHSMGGNIGLRYLRDHPDMFACAAMTAPMAGILALRRVPSVIPETMALLCGKRYVPGGGDWNRERRIRQARETLSSDPARAGAQTAWSEADPALQIGDVTFGWIHEAAVSCACLARPGVPEAIKTPVLMALAGHDRLVDNAAARRLAARLPHAQILEMPDSLHEILMERDDLRNIFLGAFDKWLKTNAIKEKLKPF